MCRLSRGNFHDEAVGERSKAPHFFKSHPFNQCVGKVQLAIMQMLHTFVAKIASTSLTEPAPKGGINTGLLAG
jgi:hypothetical protein